MKESYSTDHTNGCTESPSTQLQEEISELNKVIEVLSHSAEQYKNLYERSQVKL